MRLVSWCGHGWTSVCERWTRVYECWADCLNQDLLDFLDFQDAVCLAVRMWLGERLRVVWTEVLVNCVMGSVLSLAGAGVLVPLPARVVRELYVL